MNNLQLPTVCKNCWKAYRVSYGLWVVDGCGVVDIVGCGLWAVFVFGNFPYAPLLL